MNYFLANMEAPLVSVIIPVYNGARTIRKTVESVLSQTYNNLEIIVVDDGSTDNTCGLISTVKDKRIHYYYQSNQDRSVARNTGIQHVRGKYIAFIDADDLWLSEKVEEQVKLLEEEQELGLVYCDLYYFDDATGENLYLYSDRVRLHRGLIWRNLVVEDNFIQSPTPIIRHEVFKKVGMFDPELPPVEDWDMWLRISSVFPVDYVNKPLAKYRVHDKYTSWNKPSAKLYSSVQKLYDKVDISISHQDRLLKDQIRRKRARYDYLYFRALLHNRQIIKSLSYLVKGLKNDSNYPFRYLTRLLRTLLD